jgi:adenosylhomocysteine nucleosidase
VGIVCALATEARHLNPTLGRAAAPSPEPTLLADGTLVAVSGMGPDAAAASARDLIRAGAGALASFGLAGGLDPTLVAGDICVPCEVMTRQLPAIATTEAWRDRVLAALIGRVPRGHLFEGSLVSSTEIVSTVADKSELFGVTGAHAVDMESFAVAEVASTHRLPFIALRVVVDRALDELPRVIATASDPLGRIRLGVLLAALARSPSQLVSLVRLGSRYRAASQSMAAIARIGGWSRLAFL